MATPDCLHCHLVAEIRRWADEHQPKDDDGKPMTNGDDLVGPVLSALCDTIVIGAAEGADRIRLANAAAFTLAAKMSTRLFFEPEENGFTRIPLDDAPAAADASNTTAH